MHFTSNNTENDFFSIRIKRDKFNKRVGVSPTVYITIYYARTRTHTHIYLYKIYHYNNKGLFV